MIMYTTTIDKIGQAIQAILLLHPTFRLGGMVGLVLLALLSALCSAKAMAEPVPLSEKQAIWLFYQRNLDLLAARYNIENAQAQEIIAGAIPNPTISAQLLELSQNSNQNSSAQGCPQGGASSPTGQNLNCGPAQYYSFSQLIEMAGKRGLRQETSAIAAQAAESDFQDAVRIFTNMVRDAYYGLLQAQKNRWLAQEIVNHYKDIISNNRLRLQAGDIPESDFLRIEVEALQAQSDLDNAAAAIDQAQAALALTLNWPDKSMQFVAEDLWPATQEIGQNLPRDALISKALELRPDLQGDKQRAEQADKALILARKLKYPDVTVSSGYARDPSNTILDSYFVGVSIPVPLFYQYKGEENAAAVNLSQMRLAAQQTELGVRSDVVSAVATWKSADKVVQRYEDGLLDRTRKIRDRAELAYNKGATTILDYIDAQRTYKTVMLSYYTAVTNRINAYYDLAKSLGIEPNAELSQQVSNPGNIKSDRLHKVN